MKIYDICQFRQKDEKKREYLDMCENGHRETVFVRGLLLAEIEFSDVFLIWLKAHHRHPLRHQTVVDPVDPDRRL